MKYELFVDMDGVVSNFDNHVKKITGKLPSQMDTRTLWRSVKPYIEGPEGFWINFEKMPDADKLWNYVKPHKPEFLTAAGNIKFQKSAREKINWIRKNFGSSKVNVVGRSSEKALWAADNHILIDDSERSIIPWRKAGGIGILHKNAEDTIRQLSKLGV